MNLQNFTNELQATLDENEFLKSRLERTEMYLKKLLIDNNGELKVIPFKNTKERASMKNYQIAFGVSSIILVEL